MQHNVPLAVADHLGPLQKECFKDSKTARDYRCARTKTSCIVHEALAPHFMKELAVQMTEGPCTLITGGSSDSGIYQTIEHDIFLVHNNLHDLVFNPLFWEMGGFICLQYCICCHCRSREDEPPDSPDLYER